MRPPATRQSRRKAEEKVPLHDPMSRAVLSLPSLLYRQVHTSRPALISSYSSASPVPPELLVADPRSTPPFSPRAAMSSAATFFDLKAETPKGTYDFKVR